MKTCSVCANSVEHEAETCPHCGEASFEASAVAPASDREETLDPSATTDETAASPENESAEPQAPEGLAEDAEKSAPDETPTDPASPAPKRARRR